MCVYLRGGQQPRLGSSSDIHSGMDVGVSSCSGKTRTLSFFSPGPSVCPVSRVWRLCVLLARFAIGAGGGYCRVSELISIVSRV